MHFNHAHDIHRGERGALLVEMLVAFALVSVTLIALLSGFLSLQQAYRIEKDRKIVVDALTYVMEDVVREARVSDRYGQQCDGVQLCTGGLCTDRFTMCHIAGLNLQPEALIDYNVTGSGQLTKTVGGNAALALLPPTVSISNFQVRVFEQPNERRRIVLSVVATPNAVTAGVTPVYLQTTLTERGI